MENPRILAEKVVGMLRITLYANMYNFDQGTRSDYVSCSPFRVVIINHCRRNYTHLTETCCITSTSLEAWAFCAHACGIFVTTTPSTFNLTGKLLVFFFSSSNGRFIAVVGQSDHLASVAISLIILPPSQPPVAQIYKLSELSGSTPHPFAPLCVSGSPLSRSS